jgi:DNA invertase Pin-like site-specific DNA recombinase
LLLAVGSRFWDDDPADVGYARVSTGGQTLALPLDALSAAGCGRVYRETASGAKAERPVLEEILGYLRPGDTLVV